ncbi:hypothetical protein SY89_02533 [Halolamina pelagica]|uniref:Ferrochelatase n=1 Tax=Halolamina pelagica TaxID=699431 RepID=A0A0P7I481_9EURY|nr:hypothetical protein [Halolamina pelagica]KPN31780.1 hypothetical protein SY89_02533 [Halolamina pelagica]
MTTGIAVLNFGEPATADRAVVEDYLERIFFANMDIEGRPPKRRPASAPARWPNVAPPA